MRLPLMGVVYLFLLTGMSSIWCWADDSSTGLELKTATDQFTKDYGSLRDDLQKAHTQAFYPGTIGVGRVDLTKLKKKLPQLEERLLKLKELTSKILKVNHELILNEDGSQEFLNQKVGMIVSYNALLSSLITMRSLWGRSITNSYLNKYALETNYFTINSLLGLSGQDISAYQDSPLKVEKPKSNKVVYSPELSVKIKLSKGEVRKLIEVAKKSKKDKGHYFEVMRITLANHLYPKLIQINNYLQNPHDPADFPDPKISNGQYFKQDNEALAESISNDVITQKEEDFRDALYRSLPYYEGKKLKRLKEIDEGEAKTTSRTLEEDEIPQIEFTTRVKLHLTSMRKVMSKKKALFLNDETIEKLLTAIVDPEYIDAYRAEFKGRMTLSEILDISSAFAAILSTEAFPFSAEKDEFLVEKIAHMYSASKMVAVQTLLLDPNAVPEEIRTEVIQILQKRTLDFEEEIKATSLIQDWIKNARKIVVDNHQKALQEVYIRLINASKEAVKRDETDEDELEVDLSTLDIAMKLDFVGMNLSQEIEEAKKLMTQTDFKEAVKFLIKYAETIKRQKILVSSTRRKDNALMIDKQLEIIAKNKKDWIQIGKMMLGFDLEEYESDESLLKKYLAKEKLIIDDLETTWAQESGYHMANVNRILAKHRVLVFSDEGTDDDEELYKVLSKLDPQNKKDLLKATILIDGVAQTIYENTKKKINEVLAADNINDLRLVVAKSTFINQVMKNYPAFMDFHKEFQKEVNNPSFALMSWKEIKDKYVSLGFGVMFVHWIIKLIPGVKDHPLSRLFDAAWEPYHKTFMLVGTLMILINAVVEFDEIRDKEQEMKELEDLFKVTMEGDSLFDLFFIRSAQGELTSKKMNWWFERATEFLFFVGIPLFKQPVTRFLEFLRNKRYRSLFKTVGFKQGEYKWDAAEIDLRARRSIEQVEAKSKIIGPEMRKTIIDRIRFAAQKLKDINNAKRAAFERLNTNYEHEFKILGLPKGSWHTEAIEMIYKDNLFYFEQGLISQSRFNEIHHAYKALKTVALEKINNMKLAPESGNFPPGSLIDPKIPPKTPHQALFIDMVGRTSSQVTTRATVNGKRVNVKKSYEDPSEWGGVDPGIRKVREWGRTYTKMKIKIDGAEKEVDATFFEFARCVDFEPIEYSPRGMRAWGRWIKESLKETVFFEKHERWHDFRNTFVNLRARYNEAWREAKEYAEAEAASTESAASEGVGQ